MPYFSIETNKKTEAKVQITKSATDFISELLNKPKKYIMISLKDQIEMRFAGKTDDVAFISLKSIRLPENSEDIYEPIFKFIEDNLGIHRNRVYIELIDLDPALFAHNGKSFKK